MGDLSSLVRDPEFIALPLASQRQALVAASGDKDFSALSDTDTQKFLNVARNSQPTQFEKDRSGDQGFGKTLVNDTAQMVQNLPKLASLATPSAGVDAAVNVMKNDAQRKQEGRSLPYRVAAGSGEAIGIPARAMEEAANRGASGEIIGHAALPAAMAVAPLAAEGVTRGATAAKTATGATVDASAEGLLSKLSAARKTAEAVSNSDVVGLVRPTMTIRAQKAASALGSIEAIIRARQSLKNIPEQVVPEEVAGPVTTPSDVPLEHMPQDSPAAAGAAASVSQRTDVPAGVPPEIANIYKLRRGYQDNFEDAQIRQAMSDDLYHHAVSAGREVRAQQLAERQSAGLDVPKWERSAQFKAQQIMEQAQQQAQSVIEQARQKGERGLMASVPRNPAADAAAEEIASQPSTPSTADRISATQNLEELLRQSIARAKAAKAKK